MIFFRRILLMSPEFLVKYPLLTSDRHRPADVDDGYFLSFLPVFFFFFFFFFLGREELLPEHAIHWDRQKIEGLPCPLAKRSTEVKGN